MSVAVMALLGHVSAVQLQKYPYEKQDSSLVQTKTEKDFSDDEGDAFMEQSIKEAESEFAKKKSGVDILRETIDKSTSEANKLEED